MRAMRIVVGAFCALVGATGGAPAVAAAASTAPRAQLRSPVCQRALDPPARAVSIQAVMRPVSGTARMELRFDLLRQTHRGGRFVTVRGRNLGSWITPQDPTLGQRPGDIWIVTHPVVDLLGPATYRFRVTFRWTGSSGQVLGSTVQSGPSCYQPELRADLLVRSLSVTPAAGGRDAYGAVIANRGQTAAGPFKVSFTAAGGTPSSATVASLGPRATTRVRFVAPACSAGSALMVTVDPTRAVDESNFANNTLRMPCPAPASSS